MVIPDPKAMQVLLQVVTKPVRRPEGFLGADWIATGAELVVISETPLRDRDGVVLESDGAAIVEHRDAVGVVVSGVIGLLAKQHVVLTDSAGVGLKGAWIDGWRFVPEAQLALPGAEVGAENAPVVVPTGGDA